MIKNPSAWKEIVSELNFGKVFFFGLLAFILFRVLLRIYSGVSILTGFRLLERSRIFLNEGKMVLKSIVRPAGISEGYPKDSLKEEVVSVTPEESNAESTEKAKETADNKSFTTSSVIKYLFGFSAVYFILWTLVILDHDSPSGTDIDPISILLFLVTGGVPGIASASLATYLMIKQKKLKRAIISMNHNQDSIEIDAIVQTTNMSERLVNESIEELKSEGAIPEDICVTKTRRRKRNKKPSG